MLFMDSSKCASNWRHLRQTRVFSNEDVIEYSKGVMTQTLFILMAESARNAGFEDRVVHGMLVAALFPRIIASHFPGAVYVSQSLHFKSPVYIGEEVLGEVQAISIRENKKRYIAKFATKCFKKGDLLIIDGPSIHDIQYYGDHIFTTVTAAAVVVDEWIANTMHIHKRELGELLIGLDTEWCMPTEPDGHQQVAIIQLCVGKRCLIFQLYHADDIPPSLIQFLGNKKFKFVGKGVWNDACKLFEDYELLVAHTKDVGYWAAKIYHDRDYRKLGLKALVLDLLQKVIPKPREITMSEWNAKELTIEQIEYACLDAFVSLNLEFS
ncbi:hypothetical protein GH714_003080 [Hevea brasiliensis]|uniref:3'-5' exonuclease domain-containing protein n=1 Tax=Hevea brasiliensis TaxID=3981 RepID=A0A6A6N6Q9_HEVBR|nr:hypothetical protein GH714_003080 [Hevea brasiliensis]